MEKDLSEIERNWGEPFDLSNASPSLMNNAFEREWFATFLRNSASPADAIALWRWGTEIDVRDILPAIQVPTLIVQRTRDRWIKVEEGRYLAKHIGGSTYLELDGDDHVIWGENSDRLVDEIQAFLAGLQSSSLSERILLTVLSLEVIGSQSGQWYEDPIRTELQRAHGRYIKSTENGFAATFRGPTAAIRCAMAIRDRMKQMGFRIRAAIHIGECEKRSGDLSGHAIQLGAGLLDHAAVGEVVASQTVRDLGVDPGLAFEERGAAGFPGVPGTWLFYSVSAQK